MHLSSSLFQHKTTPCVKKDASKIVVTTLSSLNRFKNLHHHWKLNFQQKTYFPLHIKHIVPFSVKCKDVVITEERFLFEKDFTVGDYQFEKISFDAQTE